jgi:prophage maintenance system killer protein
VVSVDEQERLMTEVAAARVTREQLVAWLRDHVRQVS